MRWARRRLQLPVGTEMGSSACATDQPLGLAKPRKAQFKAKSISQLAFKGRVVFRMSCSSFCHRTAKNQVSARRQG